MLIPQRLETLRERHGLLLRRLQRRNRGGVLVLGSDRGDDELAE